MRTQNEMKKKISDAFYTVLKNTTFAKAKVIHITEAAGISHQTFYRYYLDKYDLASKIATEKFFAFYDIYSDNATWKEIVMMILYSIKNYPVFFKRLLADAEGSEIVLTAILDVTENFSGTRVPRHSVIAWISIFQEWGSKDFKAPVEEVYQQIRMYTAVREVLTDQQIEEIMTVYENRHLDYFREITKERP